MKNNCFLQVSQLIRDPHHSHQIHSSTFSYQSLWRGWACKESHIETICSWRFSYRFHILTQKKLRSISILQNMLGIIYSLAYVILYSWWKRICLMLLKHVICQIIFPFLFNETQSPKTEIWRPFHFLASLYLPFHIDHKVLPTFPLCISKIPPRFSIFTAQNYISFSLGPLEPQSLLSLRPVSFLSSIPSTMYILAQQDSSRSWIWLSYTN